MPLPSLQYYDDLYNKRKANKPVAQIDGLDREIARMRNQEIKENLFLSASPDTVARVNRISRETGELPLLVEDRINDYEKSLVNSKFVQVAEDNPGIAKWAVNNPRGAAAAADDWESLSMLGKAWETIKGIPPSLKVSLYRAGTMAQDALDAAQEITDTVLYPLDAAIATIANNYGAGLDPDRDRQIRRQSVEQRRAGNEAYVKANRPNVDGWFSRNLLAGTESIAPTATALFLRNPTAASTFLGTLVGGSEYQEGRSQGLSPIRSAVYGTTQGAIETLTERIPASRLLGDIAARSPVGKTLINQLVAEIPGEQAATFLQDLNEWATLNPEKTLSQFVAERPMAAAETLVQTIGGVGATVALTKAAERTVDATVKVGEKVAASRRAKREGAFLDDLAKASEGSKLKERDTEAFREMIRALADENDVKSIYISGEALREYAQSESFDAEGPLSRWSAEIEEAAALGGDVVMPIEEAMTILPGTPAWGALRDDMRLSPGGVSRKEAQTFDEAMADVMDELARTMAEQEKATQRKLEPIEKLSQSIAQKLQNAGFTPSAADTQARLLVQRYSTRAERLGRELTGDEFGVTINQVLPEGLAQARAADNLDLVINSYFTMKKPKEQTGKSLVEWIVSRGGITDEGGDLAAMGLGEWHKQKAFRKKAIRAFDKNQGNMLGAVSNDYSPNRVLEAAIDEGYFPELQGTEDALDMNALLTAIEEELQGKPRYAQERIVDDVQQLASQLDEYLSQAGYDPANMTREEMRAALMEAQDAQEGGYDQDTIEVDGIERPTKNSNGNPIARTEEGLRNFWRWFGDSKVVDAQGRPLVVYHGGKAGVEAFDPAKAGTIQTSDWGRGIYFTPAKWQAQGYATDAQMADDPREKELYQAIEDTAKKYGVSDPMMAGIRLGINSPEYADVERASKEWRDYRQQLRANGGGEVYSTYLKIENPEVYQYQGITDPYLAEMAKANDRDGVIVVNEAVTGHLSEHIDEILVFSPTQIKSVNNRGTFDPNDSRILFQSAYHGSPHIFDKFSLDKIGTGEGAQAYGYGLYFASKKEIAEHYRKTLSDETYVTAQGETWSPDNLQHKNVKVAARRNGEDLAASIAYAKELLADATDYTRPLLEADIAEMERLQDAGGITKHSGRLYTVDIPEDNEFLLWDKPLSEQPEKVKAALAKVAVAIEPEARPTIAPSATGKTFRVMSPGGWEVASFRSEASANDFIAKEYPIKPTTGQDVYRQLSVNNGSDRFGSDRSRGDQAASKALHDAGIAGIKYLDGGSRSDGDGSYNYVVFDDNRVSITAYEQSYGEGPRGRITFNSGQATIDLFQNRNLSTFLHEVGHLWLEELRFDAEMNDAPDQLKDDWKKVQDWFASQGHKVEGGFIPVEAHEMWARGVERYLMEGKAPNTALKRIFETFRAWLSAIYKTVDMLRSPITPEIRGVMDRLIATDEQIQEYAEQQALSDLFKSAAEAGMTGAEFAEYQRQTEEARTEANSKLIDKTMRAIRARETKRYKEAEATVREEITADVDARPLFKALRLLKTSPMDEKWIRSEMGEDSLSLLPKRVPPAYKSGGAHPDVIAEQSGFASGKAMVEALMGAEIAHRQAVEGGDKRSMRERTIAGEVDAVMQARYGDPLNDGTIEREALEAVHNEMQGEVIAAEIRVLARRTGRRPTPYAIARDWARNKVRSGVVSVEASPSAIQRYARAAAKAATKAQEAMLAQDVEEAFRQKQAQMVNNALVAEAKAAADEVEKAVKRMEKIAKRKTIKSVDQEYLEQAQALLENVDLRRRSQVGINRQNSFEAWAQEQQAAGHDVPVPPSFEQTLGKTNWTRLSVENLISLDETIKHIMHLGRLKQTLLDNKERREFEELVSEALQSAGNLRQKPPSDLMAPSYWDGIKSKILAADAALLKMETVFDWLDGNNPNGVFNRIVFRPIADAQEAERVKLQEYIEKLTDALKAVPKNVLGKWGDKVTTNLLNRETGKPFVLTREELVSMALNVGNQSNLDKLAGGYGWNEGEILATLAAELTEAEWQYVQSVWDTIDSLWPEIEAMEKRINGVAPEKIVARPVETPFGTLRGGYFPVVYDPARNYDAEANAAKGRDLFETIYTRATTPKGFTKERTNVERPIHLSLGIINRHVAEVIHDLTHREAIMQADKFLSNKRIMKAVDDTLGPEVRRQFRPWLQRIANEWAYDRAGNAGAEKFLRNLRANATIVGMGFRLSTILMQAAGYSNSFERVGAKWVARRLKDVANPAAYEFVLSKSAEVAGRMDNLDRDIRDNVKSAMGKTDWISAPKRFAFHGIAYMDRLVVIPTWLGAYDKAIAEGMADEDAVYAADKAVRQSQGSGAAKDLAAIQSGRGPAGEALKLLTMFYSYMSAFYQRLRSLGRDVRNGSVKDMPALLARAWWLIVVPPVLAELLAGRGPGEDDDEALWAFEKMMLSLVGPIPLVRDIAPIALARAKDDPTFGYKFTPVSGAGQSLINVVSDASNIVQGEETKRATRNAIETVGYFTGLTTGQMAAAVQFLVDVGYGEQDPEDFSDWWEGLNTGKIKEE